MRAASASAAVVAVVKVTAIAALLKIHRTAPNGPPDRFAAVPITVSEMVETEGGISCISIFIFF